MQRRADRIKHPNAGQESLGTRARNTLVANFLDNDSFTHLLFIDADIGFEAKSLKRFLEYDKEVLCGTLSYETHKLGYDT